MGPARIFRGAAGLPMGLLLALLVTACSTMSVHEKAILVEPVAVAPDQACDVRFFAPTAPVLDQCRVVAQVSLHDANTRTSRCGTQGVRTIIRRLGCEYEANVAVTTRIPSPLSTCTETDVSLYRCDASVLPPRPPADGDRGQPLDPAH